MDNKPIRLHNSQLTVKALSHLVLGQRWFSLGYLSLKDKTKHKGFFSEQPREYTNEKSEWRFIYFQPKVESMMVYFSHFIPGEAGKKRQYKIIMQKYVNLSKELFNLFHELSRTQRNILRRLKKRIMWNWFALWKKKTCKFDSLSISRTTIGICSTINCNTRISKSYATKKQFYYLSSCIKSNKFQTSSSLKKVWQNKTHACCIILFCTLV